VQIPPTLGVPLSRQHPDGVTFKPVPDGGRTSYRHRKVSEISAPDAQTANGRVIRAHELMHAVSSPQKVAWHDDHSFFALQATEDMHVHALFRKKGLTSGNPQFAADIATVYLRELRDLSGWATLTHEPKHHQILAQAWPMLVLQMLRAESLDHAIRYDGLYRAGLPARQIQPLNRIMARRMESGPYALLRTIKNRTLFRLIMSRQWGNHSRRRLRGTCVLIDELIAANPWLPVTPCDTDGNGIPKKKKDGQPVKSPSIDSPRETLSRHFPEGTTYEIDPELRVIIVRPPLVKPSSERLRARTRPARTGTKLRIRGLLNRIVDPQSNAPLYTKRSREFAGSVMIDYSGSMPLNTDSLTRLCEAMPFGTIRYYYGPAPYGYGKDADGIIVEWARDGRRAERIFQRCSTGNEIDAAAYDLLLRDRGPRFFIGDCGECGANFDSDEPGHRMSTGEFHRRARADTASGTLTYINVDDLASNPDDRIDAAISKIRSMVI
jgi:hypothetical protein